MTFVAHIHKGCTYVPIIQRRCSESLVGSFRLAPIQWDLRISNLDTLGTEKVVLISEVSWFQGLRVHTTDKKGVLHSHSRVQIRHYILNKLS